MRRIAALVLSALMAFPAVAQQPLLKRSVNLYVGFAAGGPADVLARLISEKLKDHIGQSVIVQNRPGAGGTIAAAVVAKAEPDGTSLLLVSSGHAGAPALFPNLPYDQRKDFVPVIALAQSPIVVLVDAKSSYHSIQQFVDAAKAAAGKLNFGTGGGGATLTALSAIMLRRAVGFDAAAIYFPGSGPANIALLGGTIDFSFDTVSGAIGHHRELASAACGDLREAFGGVACGADHRRNREPRLRGYRMVRDTGAHRHRPGHPRTAQSRHQRNSAEPRCGRASRRARHRAARWNPSRLLPLHQFCNGPVDRTDTRAE